MRLTDEQALKIAQEVVEQAKKDRKRNFITNILVFVLGGALCAGIWGILLVWLYLMK